jgi:cell division protein FtsZ
MIEAGVHGVDFVTVDGNERDLKKSRAPVAICARRQVGATGLQSSRGELQAALGGSDMVFIVGGLGGRAGTRLAAEVATEARRDGALTTAIVTTPFSFEGAVRAQQAHQGISMLKEVTNTLIVIPNDRLLAMAGGALAFHQTYDLALKIWRQSVQGISELINAPGLVNVDFADVRTIMSGGGPSIIAMGRGSGPNRARVAAEQATNFPFLEVTIDGARGVLFNISGGPSGSR